VIRSDGQHVQKNQVKLPIICPRCRTVNVDHKPYGKSRCLKERCRKEFMLCMHCNSPNIGPTAGYAGEGRIFLHCQNCGKSSVITAESGHVNGQNNDHVNGHET